MNLISAIVTRLSNRSDTEHEQALIRLLIGIVFFVYLLPDAIQHSADWAYASKAYLIVMTSFLVAAIGVFGCILIWPQPSPPRRVITNFLDVLTLTLIMSFGEERTASLFFIYLWVTFGCGFRFGSRYLLISLTLSVTGFLSVLSLSDYWRENVGLGVGILLGMVMLSIYVNTLVKRLYEALDRAAEANQAKRRFVSSVSHELRTPLNAIIGMNDLLRTTPLNSEQSEMASTMHSASRVMLSLIEDVLDFSKIEAGKLNLESVDFDLHALLQSTLTIFSRQAALKGLKLGVFVMPDVTHTLSGDAHHLQQVLVNLIGNAVKFTERGEVRLIVSALTETPQSVRLRFAVRDTGIGIPEADQRRVFESFAQADSPSVRKHRGTGLGTTIAKQLVELMDGSIGLESAPGAGSTFWFDLPFRKQAAAVTDSPVQFKNTRALLIGFPEELGTKLTADLAQWEMQSGSAENAFVGAARLAEAAGLGSPYRVAFVFAENTLTDVGRIAAGLGALEDRSMSLILCAPRAAAATWSARMPTGFASVISIPAEKRLLYNALHSVLAGEEINSGAISLKDYYERKEPTKSYHVLVADDDQINRKVIAKQLEVAGHQVSLVTDGEQALDALEEADFDVVILDSHMPVMTGLEATRLIRVMQAGRAGVPIILFSADATPEVIQEATAAGVDVFLPKPVEASRLYSTIEQLVSGRAPSESVVQAIAPQKRVNSAPLLEAGTLRDLERMSEDANFVRHLIDLFREDSSRLLTKIEDALAGHRHEDFRAYIHALKGSALNLGARKLFEHCTAIGVLDYRELSAAGGELASEMRTLIGETLDALDRYARDGSILMTTL